MVNRNIQMKKKNNDEWENLFPLSLNENIYNTEGKNLNEQFNQLTNDISNDFNSYKSQVTNQLNIFRKNVPVNHVNSDSYNTLQEALNESVGGVLFIKPDTYLINTPLKIQSNTKIIAYGSTFKRNADINHMFINDSDGSKGGYLANNNIEFYGGVIDGSGGSYVDKCTMIAFGHSRNIILKDITFKNLRDWHMIDLNACEDVLIDTCILKDYGNSTTGTEMIQLDIAKGTSQFPWFGPYDNTTCNRITIQNCYFENGVRAIGTHSWTEGKEHTRITIKNNFITGMRKEAINGLDWAFTEILNNTILSTNKGIVLTVAGKSVLNHLIKDNYLRGVQSDTSTRGINIIGLKDSYSVSSGKIINNTVRLFGSHGIGVDYCEQWQITDNEVHKNGGWGIVFWGVSHGIASGNILHSNSANRNPFLYDLTAQNECSRIIFNGNITQGLRMDSTSNGIVTNNIVVLDRFLVGSSIVSNSNTVDNSIV